MQFIDVYARGHPGVAAIHRALALGIEQLEEFEDRVPVSCRAVLDSDETRRRDQSTDAVGDVQVDIASDDRELLG